MKTRRAIFFSRISSLSILESDVLFRVHGVYGCIRMSSRFIGTSWRVVRAIVNLWKYTSRASYEDVLFYWGARYMFNYTVP